MSSINKDLIYNLYSIFKSYVKTEPLGQGVIIKRKLNKLTKTEDTLICFSTLKYSMFNFVYDDFYVKNENKNIKIIAKDSINRLTSISLCYWIMDDAS